VSVAKISLSISAQVSATHITPREQAVRRALPGSTSLSRAISIIGPIRIRVLSNSSRITLPAMNSRRMVSPCRGHGHDSQRVCRPAQ